MAGLGGHEKNPEAPRGWLQLSGGGKSKSTPWTAAEFLCIALSSRFPSLLCSTRIFPCKPQSLQLPPQPTLPELTTAVCASWNAVVCDYLENGEGGLIGSNPAASHVWEVAKLAATVMRPLAEIAKCAPHFAGWCPDTGSFAGGAHCALCPTEAEVHVLAFPSHPRVVVAPLYNLLPLLAPL